MPDPRLMTELQKVRNRRRSILRWKYRLGKIAEGAAWFLGFSVFFWAVLISVAWWAHP